jgi:hypothetical protein
VPTFSILLSSHPPPHIFPRPTRFSGPKYGEDSELHFNDDDKSYRSLYHAHTHAHTHRLTPHLHPCGTLVADPVEHDALLICAGLP